MTTPRPDQHHRPAQGGTAGSRSGAGDTAVALGYPGSPAAVQNCQSAKFLRSGAGVTTFFTFPAAARIWSVLLSYAVASDNTLAAVAFFNANVATALSGVTLAAVEMILSAVNQAPPPGIAALPLPGLPVTQGDSLVLNVNNGTAVTGAYQRASVVVLYSTP